MGWVEHLPGGVVLGRDDDAILEGLSEGVEVVHLLRLRAGEVEEDDGFLVVHVGHVGDSSCQLNSSLLKLEIPGQFALASAAFGIVHPGDGTVVSRLVEEVEEGLLPSTRGEVQHAGELLAGFFQSVKASMVANEHGGHLEGDCFGTTFPDDFCSSVDVSTLTLAGDGAEFEAFLSAGVVLLAVVRCFLGSTTTGFDVAALREDGLDGGKTLGRLELAVALDMGVGLDGAQLELENHVGAVGVEDRLEDVFVVVDGEVPGEAGVAQLSVEVD